MNLNKIYPLIFFLFISCKTNNNIERLDFISIDEIPNKRIETLFKYIYPINRPYFTKINNKIKIDSFKPVIFTYVKPLTENRNYPHRVFGVHNRIEESSIEYFRNELHGKNISYLKRDNEIVFRYYYQDYKYEKNKQTNNSPKNKEDIIKFLNENKIRHNLLKTSKAGDGDLVNLKINNRFIQIIATSTFCKSYICYNLKDSINVQKYSAAVENFFY